MHVSPVLPNAQGKVAFIDNGKGNLKKPFGHRVALVALVAFDLTLLGSCQAQTTGGLPATLVLRLSIVYNLQRVRGKLVLVEPKT